VALKFTYTRFAAIFFAGISYIPWSVLPGYARHPAAVPADLFDSPINWDRHWVWMVPSMMAAARRPVWTLLILLAVVALRMWRASAAPPA
jgi:hypothetical protein